MSETTDRYALPLLQIAQAQKEVTHNEAVATIDSLLHLAVETATLGAPPASPVAGQAWIVPSAITPTGAWAGRSGQIASFTAAGWRYLMPREGCVAWLHDSQRFAVRTALGWTDDGWPASGLRIGSRLALNGTAPAVGSPVGGTTVDVEARAALNALLTALREQGVVA